MSVSGCGAAATTRPATAARWTAALLAFEALLIFVPLVILGPRSSGRQP
jgi:hypothetical protein